MIDPLIKFKTIEGHALAADRDLGEVGPNLRVEAIAVHAEVARCVTETE